MKSVFEEASSIFKAIEKGWEKAGCPHKFSVTIFEKPEKNFFGISKKLAKVGIFFEDQADYAKRKGMRRDGQHRPYRQRRRPLERHDGQSLRGRTQQSTGRYEHDNKKQESGEHQPKKDSNQ